MNVYLEIREGRDRAIEFAQALSIAMGKHGLDTVDEPARSDMIIAVGGDGTMLSATSFAITHDVPVLGFNLGTLGFLTVAEPSDIDRVVARIANSDFGIDERLTVAAEVRGELTHGVNDVVIEKVDSQRLIELSVEIGSVHFATYRADGLILATPTGSTAYSFSAGGPLVSPTVDAFVLTPVAAHSLFSRSIVIDPNKEIAVTVNRDRIVKVSVDKHDLGHLAEGDRVVIRRGDRPAKFVTLDPPSFPGLVKHKFDLS